LDSHIDRTWIGPEFWANRLQDWEIKNGSVQCIESSKNAPLRTLNLITGSTHLKGESLELSVEIDSGNTSTTSQALAGFLIGSGGSHVDYRLSALTHHRPAEDGGMLALVNTEGRVFLIDHSKPIGKDNLWSISGTIAFDDLPLIAQGNRPEVNTDSFGWNKLTLTLKIRQTEHGLRTDLESRNTKDQSLISRLTLWHTPEAFTDGGVALVSHLSPNSTSKGFGFNKWSIEGDRFDHDYDKEFGPILTTQYTLSRNVLSLTAQAGPLSAADTQTASLEIYDTNQDQWRPIAYAKLQPMSYTFPFRIENGTIKKTPLSCGYDLKTSATESERTFFEGIIRKNPTTKEELVVAAFTGHKIFTGGLKWNHHGVWFPHNDIIDAVQHHDPDFLFFSGDQIYEGDMTPAVYEPLDKAMLDYLYKWYRWCWAFKDLTRNRPAVTIPDDHDVYHGNVWGAGGKAASKKGSNNDRQNSGGYRMPASFVNSVHRTQVSHLPPRADTATILQGISTYHGRIEYGGISFAVIADRMFKSSPTVALPEAKFDNGWAQNPEFQRPHSR
jgi:alkaline phosphatase D